MSTARAVVWLAFCSLVAAPATGKDEPPAEKREGTKKERPRVDQLGDPLPPGAIARLGSDRLRHDGCVDSLALSHDGKRLASEAGERFLRRMGHTHRSPALAR